MSGCWKKRCMIMFSFAACCSSLLGDSIKLAGIFTDNMILQQGMPVRVWGTAGPQEQVSVQFDGQRKEAVANDHGEWLVTLDPMPASSEPRSLQVSSVEFKASVSNVLVGEVWLAGGQSNMQTSMGFYEATVQADIDNANDPLLRMVTIPRLEFPGQNSEVPQWKTTTPETVSGFSATAYYFARNLRETLGIPVGIVACCVGGTPAEAWMSRAALSSNDDLRPIWTAYEKACGQLDTDEYQKQFDEYCVKLEAFRREMAETGIKPGPFPKAPMGPKNHRRPGGLYETMLTQTIPYAIRGVIWYQGENNANMPAGHHYRAVFSALINEWRVDFKNPELPFLFAQLAAFGPAEDERMDWPELRDSQHWVAKNVPNTGMAVMADGGEINNIHPHSKPLAGKRLALLARNQVYGETDLICRGPELVDVKTIGGALELTFDQPDLFVNAGGGDAFELCGDDGTFFPAKARLTVDGKLLVISKAVSDPKFVRYGWKKWFVPTLYNSQGLPASPFRTDEFDPVTQDRFYLDNFFEI